MATDQAQNARTLRVSRVVRFADGIPAQGIKLAAFDRDLRNEQPLGESYTDRNGVYRIESKGPGSHCFPWDAMTATSCGRLSRGAAEKSLEATKEVSPDGETT